MVCCAPTGRLWQPLRVCRISRQDGFWLISTKKMVLSVSLTCPPAADAAVYLCIWPSIARVTYPNSDNIYLLYIPARRAHWKIVEINQRTPYQTNRYRTTDRTMRWSADRWQHCPVLCFIRGRLESVVSMLQRLQSDSGAEEWADHTKRCGSIDSSQVRLQHWLQRTIDRPVDSIAALDITPGYHTWHVQTWRGLTHTVQLYTMKKTWVDFAFLIQRFSFTWIQSGVEQIQQIAVRSRLKWDP